MPVNTRPAGGPTTAGVRQLLLQRLDETLRRNERVVSRLRHTTALPDDWPERASLLADEEVLATLDDEARAEALALRGALARLDDGTYGICASCGGPIAPARLDALPTAAACVDCAD